ncbi:MAG: hypothetical protein IPN86_13610 [Saprospiraceae bacterium]|nr:hypothetical protein [Saprospiraceae bacterium]
MATFYDKNNNLHKLAQVFFDLNQTYKARGDHDLSIQYLAKTMSINKKLNDTTLLIRILFDKISSFENSFELDSALVTAFYAFNISSNFNSRELSAKSLFHIVT